MNRWVALCSLVLTSIAFAQAAQQPGAANRTEIMKPVMAWVRAFDTHQATFPSDAFTDDCVIIDEFAPFAWSAGATNVRAWYASVVGLDTPADRAQTIASHETVVVGNPENLRFDGALAYMSFHATWTAAAGWRMSANAWGILP